MAKRPQDKDTYDPKESYFAPVKALVAELASSLPTVEGPLFPKVKYHATEPPQTVDTPEAEAALGAGWGDSPAEFLKET
jgi:hypothetical protein